MLRRAFYVLLLVGVLLAGLLLPAGAARAQQEAAAGAEAVRQAAERVLAERFPESAGRMEVRVRRVNGDLGGNASGGNAALQLDFRGRGAAPEGLARAQLRTRGAGGQWQDAGWALLYVARFDSVVTARGRIERDAAVGPGAVEVAWMETTDVRGEPLRASDFRALTSDAEGGGALVATRILRGGRVLRQRDVRPPYAVDRGAAIEMRYTRGPLAFRLTCEAREPAFAQEAVRVYCPDTRTTYRARLTGDGTAQWVKTL